MFKRKKTLPAPIKKLGMFRGFQAAQHDRLLASWKYDGGFTSSEVSSQLETIRSRARQMAKDSQHFKRWLQLSVINIVGDGFVLKSTPHNGAIGTDSYEIDEQSARVIEWHWWNFCNYRDSKTGATYCDATGRKTDAEIDRLNVKTQKRDGEYFIHVIRGANNPYGIAWRVLRPDWCDHTYNIDRLPNGNIVHCGVEMMERTRKPVAYYFHTTPTNAYAMNGKGQPLVRIPASDIIHGFTQEEEDQPRGVPESYAALVKLKMIDELDRAELTAAREEACSTRSYEASKDASMEAFLDLTLDENSDISQSLIQEKEPGQAEILPPGWTQKINVPQHPNANHALFKSGMLRDIASGFGVEYSNFANDWSGVSFSSVRVGTISERDSWVIEQGNYISQCKSQQFLMWLESFLLSDMSGDLKLTDYDRLSEHYYRGRRWKWVDPMRDMNADAKAVEMGWKTNTQITEEMGGDYSDNVEQVKREKMILSDDSKTNIPVLNGAQIASALSIVQQYAIGAIGQDAAQGLLTAAGVPPESAINIVSKQQVSIPQQVI